MYGGHDTLIPVSLAFLIASIVGWTALSPKGWSLHLGLRKKFCMSIMTRADSPGSMVMAFAGPSVVSMVNFLPVLSLRVLRDKSYVLVSREYSHWASLGPKVKVESAMLTDIRDV